MQAYLEDESNVTYVDSIVEFNKTILAPLDEPGVITVSLKDSQMYLMLITDNDHPAFDLLIELAEDKKCTWADLFKEDKKQTGTYTLALMSLTVDILYLNGILMGFTYTHECYDPKGVSATINLLTTHCETQPSDAAKQEYYYLSREGRMHFGAFILTVFEALMILQGKKSIYLFSEEDDDTYKFYFALGYTNRPKFGEYFFQKDLESTVDLSRWEHVLVDRQLKMRDATKSALVLTQGNIAAAALLVYYYPVV